MDPEITTVSRTWTCYYLLPGPWSITSQQGGNDHATVLCLVLVTHWVPYECGSSFSFCSSSSVQSLSGVRLFVTPWTAACQASVSITNSQTLLKLMSIVSVMPSSHLILCRPLLLWPSILPSIRVFSNESVLRIRWPKYWTDLPQ